ncbi:MAG: C45 family autoproteolytic acyltransferase/hydrolase [Planctomycetota bacterium]
MNRLASGLAATLLTLWTGLPTSVCSAAGQNVSIQNPGFEEPGEGGLPAGWSVAEGGGVTGSPEFVHSGARSLRVDSPDPASVTVVSLPIQVRVGHLYRLTGWIRTAGAISDPTSRYPTAVPACLTMASFPLTNHSPTVGADSDWTRVETLFVATKHEDRVRLHLGLNGTSVGTAWFDDITLEKVDDISKYIEPETVTWFGNGYRYDDRGWIFVHIEGKPYERGYQFGYLLQNEIVQYISKLGVNQNANDPKAGWDAIRFETDTIFLRKYDTEYLTEMKGIADGAAKAGAKYEERQVDLLDIVALNSVVDLGQLHRATSVTPHALTGESFLAAEEELLIDIDEHNCSGVSATGPATADGQIVFGQIFMWAGYTGVHWDVICDVVPSEGHRLVYQTFPGGIHSGADFYINDAGIVIGETTVSQTPYEPDSTPQSNRIRKAAQYADNIDDVVRLLWEGNNGMYTNDWPLADVKTGEAAMFLLGTHKKKLWRTGEDMNPFGTPGFLWANNNNRDPEVRKEYIAQPDDRPFDLVFSPWNRDVAFNEFYRQNRGKIDSIALVNLWASSPINRAHACDGKITTSEMAKELVFLAHYGKVTLREKFPQKGYRIMPDLPDAIPHLSLGYSTPSPIFVTDRLKASRSPEQDATTKQKRKDEEKAKKPTLELGDLAESFKVDKDHLWRQTVYPHSEAENWFVSATAAYWNLLHELDEDEKKAATALADGLAQMETQYLYTVSREGDVIPVETQRAYDRYGPYKIPRIKGTFALHQMRLLLGNEKFFAVMNAIHDRFSKKEITNQEIISVAEEISGRELGEFIKQWTERDGIPNLRRDIHTEWRDGDGSDVSVEFTPVDAAQPPYHLVTHVLIEVGTKQHVRRLEIQGSATAKYHFDGKVTRVTLNPFHDFPVAQDRFYTFGNFVDDFHETLIVFGTSRQIEANHTLAMRWQETVANAYVEILPPLVKDSELTAERAAEHDLMVLGSLEDNSFLARIADRLPVKMGKNRFHFEGKEYAEKDDGLFLALPNPYNPKRVLYLFLANSALELHQMTAKYDSTLPSWAVFKGDKVVEKGYHPVERFVLENG